MAETKFNELGLKKNILKAIDDMGYTTPSKIQEQIIPVILEGHDVIGQAQTGTGKTLAFGAPLLSNLVKTQGKISSIILTPTRELAIQISEELKRISKHSKAKLLPVYGGSPIERQIKSIRKGIDIVVGTPGRVLDLIGRRVLKLDSIQFLVIDEADEMLNMGFIDDMREIISNSNDDRQTMLFSATMPSKIKDLARNYMSEDTKHVAVVRKSMTVSTVTQYYFEVNQRNRFESLCRVLDVDNPSIAIIFCKTKKGVDKLVEDMQGKGYNVEGMHGDMSQNQRLNTLKKLKNGKLTYLVATDVAARGIDVENMSHVINYDIPQDIESYVHRIGRTGRANKKGLAYTFVSRRERSFLRQIEKSTKSKITKKDVPTIEDIVASKWEKIEEEIRETISSGQYEDFISFAKDLNKEEDSVNLTAALVSMIYGKNVKQDYSENNITSSGKDVRLFLTAGRMDKLNPKKLLEFLSDHASTNKEDIGDIDIFEKFTFIDAKEDVVENIISECNGKRLCGRKLKIEVAKNRK